MTLCLGDISNRKFQIKLKTIGQLKLDSK